MAIPIGHDATFTFQKEGTYGTAFSPSSAGDTSRMTSESLTHTVDAIARNSLGLTQYYDGFGMHHCGGNTTFEVQYGGQEEIFRQIFGTYAFSAVPTPDTHTFTAVGNVTDGLGLTIAIYKDLAAAEERFAGCKASSATFTMSNAGFMECSVDWLGVHWGLGAATTGLTFDTNPAVHWSHFDTTQAIMAADTAYKLRDFSFTVNNNLQETYDMEGLTAGGSLNHWPAEPSHTDRQQVTGSFTLVYDTKVLTTYIETGAITAADMLFGWDAPTGGNYLNITFDNCHINASQPISSGGEILQTVDFQAFGAIDTAIVTFVLGNAVGTLA